MDSIPYSNNDNQYNLINADILEWAATYEGPLFHAAFMDPPYHLTIAKRFGKPGSKPAKVGVYNRASKGFMNQSWDGTDDSGLGIAFRPETWAALSQHLHPGGFILAFAGTRGYHRMACAMEDSGLIIHPSLVWVFCQGFPKATRIDTQVDREAGVEREIIGRQRRDAGSKSNHAFEKSRELEFDITQPATPLAQTWAGHRYGLQALKPALEFIAVASKPQFDSNENLFYNEARDLITDIDYLLEDLWTRFAYDAEIISQAESEVNIALNNVQTSQRGSGKVSPASAAAKDSQDAPVKSKKGQGSIAPESAKTKNLEGKSPVSDAENKSIKPPVSLKMTTTDTVAEDVSWQTTNSSAKEPANIAGSNSPLTGKTEPESIAQTNADTPPKSAPYSTIPLETATDTSIAMAMLRYNSEKAKLDLSTIWLWRLIWGDLCSLVNKSIIEMEPKMITGLRTLNYSLRSLMLASRDTVSEKNSSGKLWSYATIANNNFIGLLTFLKIQLPIAPNVNKPALEFIAVVQKPYEGRPVDCITRTGAGAFNIEAGRIGTEEDLRRLSNGGNSGENWRMGVRGGEWGSESGRWPANLLLDEAGGALLDRQSGDVSGRPGKPENIGQSGDGEKKGLFGLGSIVQSGYQDSGGASRMFFQSDWSYEILEQLENADPLKYEPKVSTAEGNVGAEAFYWAINTEGFERVTYEEWQSLDPKKRAEGNIHPTKKPISLCKYLCELISPPDAYAPPATPCAVCWQRV